MTDTAPAEPELKGIGGWLLLPVFHLIFDMGFFLWITGSVFAAHAATMVPTGQQVAIGVYMLNGVVAVYALVCLIRLFQKKANVPTLMTVFYLLVIAKAVLDLAGVLLYPGLSTEPDAVFEDSRGLVQALVAGVIWIAYFHKSERVANTFVN